MSTRIDAVDLMKLYAMGSNNGWNAVLNRCVRSQDINALSRLRRGIQIGMTDLANKKLNTEEINVWFARLMKSIENTAKRIIRAKYPNPCDSPLDAPHAPPQALVVKRKRDKELADFFKRSSF